MGHNYHSLSTDATIMGSENCPITGEHVGIIFFTLRRGFRASELPSQNVFKLCKKLHLIMLITIRQYKMGVTELVFELSALKAKIKAVFSRSYCCYGNLLCHKINSNLFPDDLQFVDTIMLVSTSIEWL